MSLLRAIVGSVAIITLVQILPMPALAQTQSTQAEVHQHEHRLAPDPVCGMMVESAHASFTSVYEGKTYVFCSEACKKKFDQAPARYLAEAPGVVDLADARSAYERAPGDPALALVYGDKLLKANRPAEARPVFEKLIAEPGGATPAQIGEAHFQMGQVWLKERNYDKALESWGVVLDRYAATPRASHATINTAAVLYQVKDQNARAFEVLEAGLKAGRIIQEHLPTAYYLQYSMYFDARDYPNARRLLKELPTEGDRYEHIKESIPVVLWKTGEVDEARRLTAALYEQARNSANALNNLAAVFVEHELELGEALRWAERAVELSGGKQAYILDTYADALFANGQVDKAIAAEEKAVELAKSSQMREEFVAKLERFRAARKK